MLLMAVNFEVGYHRKHSSMFVAIVSRIPRFLFNDNIKRMENSQLAHFPFADSIKKSNFHENKTKPQHYL